MTDDAALRALFMTPVALGLFLVSLVLIAAAERAVDERPSE